MFGILGLTAVVLSSAPLKVRILEREKPVRASIEAKELRCDGTPMPGSSVEVEGKGWQLTAAGFTCDEIEASGEVRVKAGEVNRQYTGRVLMAWEGTVLRLLNEVELEDYLPGVVGSEAAQLPPPAQRAPAVVSRTFALASRGRHGLQGFDLCDLAHCQVYRGKADENKETKAAVLQTKNLVLLVGGVGLKPAFFHSACGGGTSRAVDVFGEDGRVLLFPTWARRGRLVKTHPTSSGLSKRTARSSLKRDATGRVMEVRAFGQRFKGTDFQSRLGRAFGYHVFRSMKVTASEVEGVVRFEGAGLGHGVGLCQHGARAMAEAGADQSAILKKYFPDCRVAAAP